jgi:hypothetical protein
LGVNLAGVEIILNMREKMSAMQDQIENFVANLNQELSHRANQVREDENNSLIPVIRVTSVASMRSDTRRPSETRRKHGR